MEQKLQNQADDLLNDVVGKLFPGEEGKTICLPLDRFWGKANKNGMDIFIPFKDKGSFTSLKNQLHQKTDLPDSVLVDANEEITNLITKGEKSDCILVQSKEKLIDEIVYFTLEPRES